MARGPWGRVELGGGMGCGHLVVGLGGGTTSGSWCLV